jgi:hypothetical protein
VKASKRGTLTRAQRVEIANDVIATLGSRQKKLFLESNYMDTSEAVMPRSGELTTKRIKGECGVCARGLLFLKSIDRYDNCDISRLRTGFGVDWGAEVINRTESEWGSEQAELIETAYEGNRGFELSQDQSGAALAFHGEFRDHYGEGQSTQRNKKYLMSQICSNIVANKGVFRPETSLPTDWRSTRRSW